MLRALAACVCATVLLATAPPATGASDPKPLGKVTGCRTIAENAERLACYDREVAALDAAERAKDIVVVNRAQAKEAGRTLFGLPLPDRKLFGGAAEAPQEIESFITWSRQDHDGWTVRLADGSTWRQIDTTNFYREPAPGLKVVVRRRALGSYVMSVAQSPGIRVKRVI